jgi:hypothetical protein
MKEKLNEMNSEMTDAYEQKDPNNAAANNKGFHENQTE